MELWRPVLLKFVPAAVACASLAIGRPASAVIITTTGGTNYGTDASETISPNFGFANVGARSNGNASYTYLGNGWIITARHVAELNYAFNPPTPYGTPTFNGQTYNRDFSTVHYLVNPEVASNSSQYNADVKIFRLDPNAPYPNLPTLSIASTPIAVSDYVIMAGNGLDRGPLTTYHFNTTEQGYQELSNNVRRYGENTISEVDAGLTTTDSGDTFNHLVYTNFDRPVTLGGTGFSDEAQASLGDSGGGVFGGPLALKGIMVAAHVFPDSGNNYVLFPSSVGTFQTVIVDLSYYRSQILAIASLVPGDVNDDHVVNQLDLNVVFANWLTTNAIFSQGDTNGDAVVNQLDINLITGNWMATDAASFVSLSAATPEPSSAALLVLGLLTRPFRLLKSRNPKPDFRPL